MAADRQAPPNGSADAGEAAVDPGRRWILLSLVCASQFMVILDTAIINVALPSVQADLGFTDTGLTWVVNGYLLTFSGLMLLGGRAADLFGARRLMVLGGFLFSAASLAAGLATAREMLVAARVVQGTGAALLAPATLAVINTRITDPAARARAFGAWTAAGGVGGLSGALVGGALTTGLTWRWVFLVNVPIGAALVTITLICLPTARPTQQGRLDLAGALTGTAGLAILVYGVMQTANHTWTSMAVAVPFGAGVLLLAAFVAIEARLTSSPMLPLRLLKAPQVAVSDGTLLLFGAIAIAMWYFSSLFMQHVLGYSAFRAGLGQTPAAVLFALIAGRAGALQQRIGVRRLLIAGSGSFLIGFVWLAQAGPGSGFLTGLLGPTLLIAIGIGFTFPTLMAAATAHASDADSGIAGGLATTAQQVGGAIGLAVLATAANARTASEGDPGSPVAVGAGYQLVFMIAAGLGVAIAALSMLQAPRQRG